MAQVSALFAVRMISEAGPQLDREALFRSCGLDMASPPDQTVMVSDTDYYSLLETIAEHERPDIGFHIRVSRSISCADLGAVGLAWKSAPDLRRSFRRMDRYSRLYNTASSFELVENGDTYLWTHTRTTPDRLGMYLSNEGALATYVNICREATGAQNRPQAVQFRHQAIGSQKALEAHFRCPVTFGADVDAIVLPAARLDMPNLVGDESIWNFFASHVEENLPEEEVPFERQLVLQIADLLTEGVPPLGQVAESLGMSARTLQRRLADSGVTYQNLVNQARLELAQSLMGETSYSLAEIAFLTGFSEQSAFTRAFKRWVGKTPGAFRSEVSA
ncbi:AraC family transcriptional regulator [Henriciella mobilis]|uniref:AraC family transcriptional regulator n=1 Tax=Henriciella mobilis TaxID=2305467 RepID=UPI000E674681|nr:AraC family transcriptional regulator [Henriciella mobilis]RIJ17211.1 AraC family transcriptional regulator [Henriciella mobilis]RIJ22440.1 AraC family transcriptional regulator [Henriciella mobilis]